MTRYLLAAALAVLAPCGGMNRIGDSARTINPLVSMPFFSKYSIKVTNLRAPPLPVVEHVAEKDRQERLAAASRSGLDQLIRQLESGASNIDLSDVALPPGLLSSLADDFEAAK